MMQPPKVRKTPQKPTICPCGSTGNASKSSGKSTFDAGVRYEEIADILAGIGRDIAKRDPGPKETV